MAPEQATRMPVLYLSHGAPPLADDPIWPGQLAAWSATLPVALGATEPVPLVYDFWGFPQHYYEVRYPAPGAPELAGKVRKLLRGPGTPVQDVPDRGLDHGAYVPLLEMYPDADLPVLQMSLPTLDPRELMSLGRKLAPLRDEGVLIVGSGFFTHNLRALTDDGSVHPVMTEFDDWGRDVLAASDIDALLDFENKAPAAHLVHPHRPLRAIVRRTRRGRSRPRHPAHRHRRLLARHGQTLHPARLNPINHPHKEFP